MDIKKKEQKNDRHSRMGVAGSPKKGGAGGKGTWGVGGMDDLKESPLDRGDPNYNSDEEVGEGTVLRRHDGTTPIEALLQEYFSSGDTDEAAKAVKELPSTAHPALIKKAILKAMENHAFERELVSRLISTLNGSVLTGEDIAQGFQVSLDALDDAALDTPDAVDVLSKFLARAVVDDVVPPAFLRSARAESKEAKECLALVQGLTTERHRLDRLAHVWGPGDLSSVKRLKEESNLLLEEWMANGDLLEADRAVRNLNAPSFHPQLVKLAIRLAIARKDHQKPLDFLAKLSKEGLLSQAHLERGFRLTVEALPDMKLDLPDAPQQLKDIVSRAQAQGSLPATFTI